MGDESELQKALNGARRSLLEERNEAGHWEGELSTSALSTATALVALGTMDPVAHKDEVGAAVRWISENQNADGGWGDTVKSFSNVSTTLLCWSALTRFGDDATRATVSQASYWIRDYVGSLDPELIAETVKARYGKDRTFSVPILMLCAICGTLGPRGWDLVLRLPFELSIFPRHWFAIMRLPVVSYALPAMIAIGYAASCKHRGVLSLLGRLGLSSFFWRKASRLLTEIQPESGGFLEAAPLTSFVTMALVSAEEKDHPVAQKGVRFLRETVRSDGSWPIDTNLATWSTTLAVKALASDPANESFPEQEAVCEWILAQQYREVHPFTNSPPGGWAWTDLTGGVPDADDTPGALLALRHLRTEDRSDEILEAAEMAIEWLLQLQNRDGGIPTFCRGWGALPFDRSSPDLTAHTLRAWHEWRTEISLELCERTERATEAALSYLQREQRPDGSWSPLWFGNQYRFVDEENPVYGTAMVVRALDAMGREELADAGAEWLIIQQNSDGGWGGKCDSTPSSIEETALAISTLAFRIEAAAAVERGVEWLINETKEGTAFEPTPIGFYFAKLWYFEKSYPIIWTTEALGRALDARLRNRKE